MDTTKKLLDFSSLTPKVIISLETPRGCMQVLEYVLQDFSFLHVIRWNLHNDIDAGTLLPNINSITFFRNKDGALLESAKISGKLFTFF